MTVVLIGNDDPEYEYAEKIKECLEQDKRLKEDLFNKIIIIPSVQCYGQSTQDIDIVVLGILNDYYAEFKTSIYQGDSSVKLHKVKIKSFCCVIEVKKHDVENIRSMGQKIYVTYAAGKEEEVTRQSNNQSHSLGNFLLLKLHKKPYVSNLIFFPKEKKENFSEDFPDVNVLFGDLKLQEFWEKMCVRFKPQDSNGNISYSANFNIDFLKKVENLLTKRISATRLDKEKVDKICKKIVKEQQYGEKLGKQLLIFRGRGGTGKTYRLLNLAYQFYNTDLSRVLILTYNHALIADIKRLFAIMRIKDGLDESIQIKSLYQFWYTLFHRLGIRSKEDMENPTEFGEIPRDLKERTLEIFRNGPSRRLDLSIENPDLLAWDYIMVDEAQDWPKDEKELLYAIFGSEKVVVADGYDQLIRTGIPTNWAKSIRVKEVIKPISLTKSMRQKRNLVIFLKEFASLMKIGDLNIEEDENLRGGKVIIQVGDYTPELHQELIKRNLEDKNENVDMLFCISPKYIDQDLTANIICNKLNKWGFSVWNGVDQNIRKGSFPTEVSQFRVVQYDSCRGLEGWVTVNIGFDDFYNYKLSSFEEQKGQIQLKSEGERRKEYAANWLLIPLTRSMDTLVIQINDPNSELGKKLKLVADNNPEFVEWRA